MQNKKEIKIKFVDFWNGFDVENNDFTDILSKNYIIKFSENPEYIIYSCFGSQHLKYNCIKIFYTGECVVPNFNMCDYAIGFDYISYGDRYCRVPLYSLFQYKEIYEKAKEKHKIASCVASQNRSFCAMVVSNDAGQKARRDIFYELNSYKPVHSGGKYLNTIGYRVKDKIGFLSNYKFSIAFENCNYLGYTTEKIVDSFAAGTIPIYMGNPIIAEEFNEKAFINCNKFSSLKDVVEYVKLIDNDEDLYTSMLAEPIMVRDTSFKIEEFLTGIFSQTVVDAERRPKNTRTEHLVKDESRIAFANQHFFRYFNLIKSGLRRLKNRALF